MKSLGFVMKTRRFFEVVYEYYVFVRSNETTVFFGDYFRPSVTYYQRINILSNFREILYKSSL